MRYGVMVAENPMADKATKAIDKAYDQAEHAVGMVAAVLGVDTRDERPAVETAPASVQLPAGKPTLTLAAPASEQKALPAPPKFTLTPAIDAATRKQSWVISDGTGTMYTCADEAFARAVLAELAKQGAA